jgi:hypothetical protein
MCHVTIFRQKGLSFVMVFVLSTVERAIHSFSKILSLSTISCTLCLYWKWKGKQVPVPDIKETKIEQREVRI